MQRILIIEDDQPTRSLMAQVFRFEGFEALEAANGEAGVGTAIACVPDLIVCDIMMPDLDGFGVLQALRSNPATALTPFIFVSAKVAGEDRRQGMEEGADDYITKPYNPDVLVASIRRRLEKRQRQVEENRRQGEEVGLAVAASMPREIVASLEYITTLTNLVAFRYSGHDPQVAAMHEAVVKETGRLRRLMRRLHLYGQLPQLYAKRFELNDTKSMAKPELVLERVARDVAEKWGRDSDLLVSVDPARLPLGGEYLAVIVEELVDNACKFSEPNSPVQIKGCSERGYWTLAVSNLGTGISADHIKQIGAFKQFWSDGAKPRGLGLGLALTQGLARLHGCEFALHCSKDTTVATVLIPLET